MSVKGIKKLKSYEITLILKPLLPDDVRKEIHKEFVDLVSENKGEVIDVDVWGKRYLSYDIKGHNEGYYIIYTFSSYPKEIAEIRRKMELKQEVLRYMVVEVDDVSTVGKKIKKKEIEI
ncbi:MAG: 30S ribosomal protein S6 [Candidatus Dojkabacteria bacterium]|nr:30S ribosomal protein S6 [Candidatus Dojkabacteria bacterium]